MLVKLPTCISGINNGNHTIQAEAGDQERVRHHGVQNRRRVGKAGCFNDHAVERRDDVFFALDHQTFQRIQQVASDRAAKASAVQQHGFFVNTFNQGVVNSDLTELIHDDRHTVHAGVADQLSKQG